MPLPGVCMPACVMMRSQVHSILECLLTVRQSYPGVGCTLAKMSGVETL